jgi:hypothetical protein
MNEFRITLTAKTTTGQDRVTTDPVVGLGDAMDHLHGMIAAVGENNVLHVEIERSLDVEGAIARLKMIRDDSTCPMNIAADIDQVLVEDLHVRDGS